MLKYVNYTAVFVTLFLFSVGCFIEYTWGEVNLSQLLFFAAVDCRGG
jgi:hypothetical protein